MIYPWVVWWNMWAAMWMPHVKRRAEYEPDYEPGEVVDFHDHPRARRAWGKKCG